MYVQRPWCGKKQVLIEELKARIMGEGKVCRNHGWRREGLRQIMWEQGEHEQHKATEGFYAGNLHVISDFHLPFSYSSCFEWGNFIPRLITDTKSLLIQENKLPNLFHFKVCLRLWERKRLSPVLKKINAKIQINTNLWEAQTQNPIWPWRSRQIPRGPEVDLGGLWSLYPSGIGNYWNLLYKARTL